MNQEKDKCKKHGVAHKNGGYPSCPAEPKPEIPTFYSPRVTFPPPDPIESIVESEWMLDFAFVMESLGAAKPSKEPEKWEQLMVLIEARQRTYGKAEWGKGYDIGMSVGIKEMNDIYAQRCKNPNHKNGCPPIIDLGSATRGNYFAGLTEGIEKCIAAVTLWAEPGNIDSWRELIKTLENLKENQIT